MISLVELPPNVQPGELVASYAHTPSVAAFIARPYDKSNMHSMIADLVRATLPGNPVVATHDSMVVGQSLFIARAITLPVTHVLVCSAENFNTEVWDSLALLVTSLGIPLILAYGIDNGEPLRQWGESQLAHDYDWSDLALPQAISHVPLPNSEPFPEDIPHTNFVLFRSSARSLMSDDAFAIVDRTYKDTYRLFRDPNINNVETVCAELSSLLAATESPAEALTITCAAKAAMLSKGLFMQINAWSIRHFVEQGANRRLSQREWEDLRALAEPQHAAIIALLDDGYDETTINTLTIQDANNLTLSSQAHGFVQSQVLFRLMTGADSSELLTGGGRSIKAARAAAGQQGIATRSNFLGTPLADTRSSGLRVSVRELN